VAAALETGLAAYVLDEDAAHGLGSGVEEVAAAGPPDTLFADQAQVRVVDGWSGVACERFQDGESPRRPRYCCSLVTLGP
jgi:hypothetical protein